ncbi:hypothetical protein P261_00095 [Lachnospiraceae bacterium TWA4]|nr:hypothetical protein P261_00095 [Lachnospiraceae bacterium TWA4]
MKCLCCGKEMQKGKVDFMSTQGFGSMLASFISEDEAKKGFFKRQTKEKIILSTEKVEAYYCPDCKKLLPVLDI